MEGFVPTETLLIELLLVVSLVAIGVRRLRIPYTVALVVVGLAITFGQRLPLELTPDLVMALFVPPLVFEAAFHINLNSFRRNLVMIGLFAVPGVILTTLVVGAIVVIATPVSLPVALVFGALIAATDPVAVVALFRTLGVPKRLAVLVEAESLLNDGTAIVIFDLMLAVALTNHFDIAGGLVDFVYVSVGGVLVGVILGWIVSRLIAYVDDYLIEITLTTVLAFGAYLVGERLHVSGVLAVVAAGLVNGNLGQRGMSPTTRIVLVNFWEYVAFLANSLVFLLIGLRVDIAALVATWQPILAAVVAVLVARTVVVYGLGFLANRISERIPFRWQHVMAWSGLRGAVSLALALTLPATLGADRDLLRVMAFGVVLFSLIGQGITMKWLLRWLGLATRSEEKLEYEIRHARLAAVQASMIHMERQHQEGLIPEHAWETIKSRLSEQMVRLSEEVRELLNAHPSLEAEGLNLAEKEAFRAQRSALSALRHDGVISDEAYEHLIAEVDEGLEATESDEVEAPPLPKPARKKIGMEDSLRQE